MESASSCGYIPNFADKLPVLPTYISSHPMQCNMACLKQINTIAFHMILTEQYGANQYVYNSSI